MCGDTFQTLAVRPVVPGRVPATPSTQELWCGQHGWAQGDESASLQMPGLLSGVSPNTGVPGRTGIFTSSGGRALVVVVADQREKPTLTD